VKRRFLSLLAFVGSLVILPFGLHAEGQDHQPPQTRG